MTYFMSDVEADGPAPGIFSMVSIGIVVVEPSLSRTFYGTFKPISDQWDPEALAVSGFTREQTLAFDDPKDVLLKLEAFIQKHNVGRPTFIADNNGFDWQWPNYYFHKFLGRNPFGYSSKNLGSIYNGFVKDCAASFKHLRKTKHDHHPVNDAKGNAEALLEIKNRGLKIDLSFKG